MSTTLRRLVADVAGGISLLTLASNGWRNMLIPKDPRIVNPQAVIDYKRRHPYCEYVSKNGLKCGSPYSEVHHIKFKSAGGDDAEFQDGKKQLETLCRRHHEVRHGVRRGE